MGLSLGINFSVKSTLICDFTRPGDQGKQLYAKSEILQMTGRAGRRGIDFCGFNLWPSTLSYRTLGQPKRENCYSRLKVDQAHSCLFSVRSIV